MKDLLRHHTLPSLREVADAARHAETAADARTVLAQLT